MSKVLYITANVKPVQDSYSLTVGEAFIREYEKTHPDDEITHLDLFKSDVPYLDAALIGYLYHQIHRGELDPTHLAQVEAMERNLVQFMGSDKFVFATPMWNLSVPPVVKAYIDNIAIVGKTFQYTAEGSVGLMNGKKAVCIEASGGVYCSGPAASIAHGISYIKSILNFFGITDITEILVEGVNDQSLDVEKIKRDAIDKAIVTAAAF